MRMTPSTFDRRIFARFSSFCGVEDYGRFAAVHMFPPHSLTLQMYTSGV
jgi:hypothetical protein